ncbi:hypothetical protein ANA_C10572 [Anabaena sp. 90]|nr:hypothetical protein ANA_C10572 [Anabaena sp. 90]
MSRRDTFTFHNPTLYLRGMLEEVVDDPAKFLLAGHRGGGKTTELRRLEQKLGNTHTVIWIDTQTALDRYNIGYAEVVGFDWFANCTASY